MSGILPIKRGRGEEYKNCRRMAINTQVQKVCMEEGVGFVDMWLNFVGRDDFFMRNGLHLIGKCAAVLGCEFVKSYRRGHRYHTLFKLDVQGKLTEKAQRSTTTNTHPKKFSPIISNNELKCVYLNARSIVNKKSELDIMVADIDPHVIGIIESWANKDIVDTELALTRYVMFRKDRRERRGGVYIYIYILNNLSKHMK